MRIVVHGQQAFGQAVLERLLARGETVVGVFCAPDREGRPTDPLKEFAAGRGLPVHQPDSWKTDQALSLMRAFEPDLCVMAYVTLFVPQPVLDAPALGTIQYHPSLLPKHRGPSSINWPIIMGETKTGLTIFWPDEGLDEGPILLQKEVEIGPNDTLGSVYFNHLFPMGVEAMVEAVDLVRAGNAPKIEQDHAAATYESWCRKSDAKIDWAKPVAAVHNLIRGTDPQPGAWTLHGGNELQIFDVERGESTQATAGTITAVADDRFTVAAGGGVIVVKRVRPKSGKKMNAGEYAKHAGLEQGMVLGAV